MSNEFSRSLKALEGKTIKSVTIGEEHGPDDITFVTTDGYRVTVFINEDYIILETAVF